MATTNCPGCDHWDNRHAGGSCYECGFCGWSRLDLPQFKGWWDWRKGTPPGVSMLAVPKELLGMDPAAAVAEAERLLGLR